MADQINASQSSTDTPQHQHLRRLCESDIHGWIAAKKPLLKDTNKKKRLAWAKKHEQWKLDRWKSVLWSDESKCEISGSNLCLCETHTRWTDDLHMCGSHREAWRRWCDGALLVKLSLIYLEFKSHLTRMATTALCSDTPSHLFCGIIICFSTGKWPKKHLQEWWSAASDDLASTITRLLPNPMVWDELERRVKEKHPRSAQHMWELLQDGWKNTPCEAGWENAIGWGHSVSWPLLSQPPVFMLE
jgi:hypothetical protein